MTLADGETTAAPAESGPARMMSGDMGMYYCNCALVATTPKDVCLLFGRVVPLPADKGTQTLGELYERQVYMTIQQAEELAGLLTQTVKAFGKQQGDAASPEKQDL